MFPLGCVVWFLLPNCVLCGDFPFLYVVLSLCNDISVLPYIKKKSSLAPPFEDASPYIYLYGEQTSVLTPPLD